MESLSKSQGAYGETWENQYRLALAELESLRDENACLKMKIRRQYKQIELLTRKFIYHFNNTRAHHPIFSLLKGI